MGRLRWKRVWVVFHIQFRTLCFFKDKQEKKLKSVLYFRCKDEEVYVDRSIKRSPSPSTTFCVWSPRDLCCLVAPSAVAMSIWVHALSTVLKISKAGDEIQWQAGH